jgi:hypothetical protein
MWIFQFLPIKIPDFLKLNGSVHDFSMMSKLSRSTFFLDHIRHTYARIFVSKIDQMVALTFRLTGENENDM